MRDQIAHRTALALSPDYLAATDRCLVVSPLSFSDLGVQHSRSFRALKGDTEQMVAFKIGMNHHTLHRWLSDNESPKKGEGKLALTALFLRRAGYL